MAAFSGPPATLVAQRTPLSDSRLNFEVQGLGFLLFVCVCVCVCFAGVFVLFLFVHVSFYRL